jgi:hypothetical protein
MEVSVRGLPETSHEASSSFFGTITRVNAAGLPQVLMCLSSLATTAIQLLAEASQEPEKLVLQRLLLAEEVTLQRQWGTQE